MKTFRRQIQPPPIVSGYRIDDVHRWSIVVPEAAVNLCANPSFETNTTNWAAVSSASIARSTVQQRHGANSLAITMTAATGDGAAYGTSTALSTTSGQSYTASIDVYAPAGMPLKLYFATTGGVQVGGAKQFKGTGRWQRVAVTFNETSTTSRRVHITKDSSAMTGTVYIDGCQIENKTYDTTYCDGDQRGLIPNQLPPPYQWTGTPHGSTSTRSSQTRGGGRVLPLSRYGFMLLGMTGLGLNVPNVAATDYAQIDGGQYQRAQKPPRAFTLTGRFDARTPIQLSRQMGDLFALTDRDIIGDDQPLMLCYRAFDCERAISEEVMVPCAYTGGLEGNVTSHVAVPAAMNFTIYNTPAGAGLVAAGEDAASLTVQTSVANANRVIKRSGAGVWSALGSGGSGSVSAFARGLDGTIYIVGTFTNWGGDANADNIVRYNPNTDTFTACSTGTNGGINCIAVLPDGRIVIGGSFTSAGGVANTVRIAVYNPTTDAFSALGTGASTNTVVALAVAANGDIYAGGSFGAMGGVANTLRLARWSASGSAWNALSTGADGQVNSLTFGLDGTLYITGQFNNLGAVAALRVGSWNGTAFNAMGTGLNNNGIVLATGLDGTIYVGGSFTSAGGSSNTVAIARWNGVQWSSLATGLDSDVYGIAVAGDGTLYICGVFTAADGIAFPDSITRWNGSAFTSIGADLPGTFGSSIYTAVFITSDNTLYMGYADTGTATTEGITTVTNGGSTRTYPRLILTGPSSGTSRIHKIENYTTRRALYFSYTINAGETAILDFTPDNQSFSSDFQPNLTGTILPGSNEDDFFLQPGNNSISLFSVSSTVTAVLVWTPVYASLMDAIYR